MSQGMYSRPGSCIHSIDNTGVNRCETVGRIWSAGQAVVQMVEDGRTHLQYAMKFFLSRSAFRQEKELYTNPEQPLGHFLPQLHSIIEESSGTLTDRFGNTLPSCIVMEKGEALNLLVNSSGEGLDMVTGLQVCCRHPWDDHAVWRARVLHQREGSHSTTKGRRSHITTSTCEIYRFQPACV
jgi:hypothetical protein